MMIESTRVLPFLSGPKNLMGISLDICCCTSSFFVFLFFSALAILVASQIVSICFVLFFVLLGRFSSPHDPLGGCSVPAFRIASYLLSHTVLGQRLDCVGGIHARPRRKRRARSVIGRLW